MATVRWLNHDFEVFTPPGVKWYDVSGVYLFVGINPDGNLYPLYIGETESLAKRLPNHERWPEAALAGATQIHARAVPLEDDRTSLEAALIEAYSPRLNVQHRP